MTNPTVFLVDDDLAIRKSLHALLTSIGLSNKILGLPRPISNVGSPTSSCLTMTRLSLTLTEPSN